jgi:DnaJ family protein A protein 2
MFFGGGRGRRSSGPQRGEDKVHPLKCDLADLYNGRVVKLALTRKKPCVDCEGRGGKPGAERTCSDCRGQGVRIQMRQIAPGMVQQMQSVCPTCRGEGKSLDEKDKCKSCKGNKIYQDRKVLEVQIEKGMKHQQKIKFSGEADEIPGTLPGDIIIVIQEKEHEIFKRKGPDLIVTVEISISESLCGFVKIIKHLDERLLKIDVPAGKVTKHGQVKQIPQEGMPHHGNPFVKGSLFVHFTVKFPDNLPAQVVETLKSVLPKPPAIKLNGEEEECNLFDVDISQFGQHDSSGHGDDDDDDERGGAQRVQCGQN